MPLWPNTSLISTPRRPRHSRAERDYRAAKGHAESLPASGRRQAELTKLKAEHDYRLDAIDRLFEMLRTGYRQDEINDITAEFQLILNDPSAQGGIDAAIAYLHGKEEALLAEAGRRLERRDEEERRARAARRCAACWSPLAPPRPKRARARRSGCSTECLRRTRTGRRP